MCVCHNCPKGDNPSCVRPDHLFIGTVKDNNADRAAKGRSNPRVGVDSHLCKTREEEIVKVIELYESGVRQCDIVRITGIDQQRVSLVVNNKSWKHLPRKSLINNSQADKLKT